MRDFPTLSSTSTCRNPPPPFCAPEAWKHYYTFLCRSRRLGDFGILTRWLYRILERWIRKHSNSASKVSCKLTFPLMDAECSKYHCKLLYITVGSKARIDNQMSRAFWNRAPVFNRITELARAIDAIMVCSKRIYVLAMEESRINIFGVPS